MENVSISPKYNYNKGSPRNNEKSGNRLLGPLKDEYKDSLSKKRMRVHMVDANEIKTMYLLYKWILSFNKVYIDIVLVQRENGLVVGIWDLKDILDGTHILLKQNEIRNVRDFVNYENPTRRKSKFHQLSLGR